MAVLKYVHLDNGVKRKTAPDRLVKMKIIISPRERKDLFLVR